MSKIPDDMVARYVSDAISIYRRVDKALNIRINPNGPYIAAILTVGVLVGMAIDGIGDEN